MMIAWMLYATVTGVLIAAAALAIERLLGPGKRPVRLVWLGGMIMTVVLPLAATLWPATPGAGLVAEPGTVTALSRAINIVADASRAALSVSPDIVLASAWTALSVFLAVRLMLALRSVAVRRKE